MLIESELQLHIRGGDHLEGGARGPSESIHCITTSYLGCRKCILLMLEISNARNIHASGVVMSANYFQIA